MGRTCRREFPTPPVEFTSGMCLPFSVRAFPRFIPPLSEAGLPRMQNPEIHVKYSPCAGVRLSWALAILIPLPV